MTKDNSWILYVALGGAAIYTVYKLVPALTSTFSKTSDTANAALDVVKQPVDFTNQQEKKLFDLINYLETGAANFTKDAFTGGTTTNKYITNLADTTNPLLSDFAKEVAALMKGNSTTIPNIIPTPLIATTALNTSSSGNIAISNFLDTTKTISSQLGITPKLTTSGGSVITSTSPVKTTTNNNTTSYTGNGVTIKTSGTAKIDYSTGKAVIVL